MQWRTKKSNGMGRTTQDNARTTQDKAGQARQARQAKARQAKAGQGKAGRTGRAELTGAGMENGEWWLGFANPYLYGAEEERGVLLLLNVLFFIWLKSLDLT